MTHFSMDDPASGTGTLVLSGDLTIQHAQELKTVLVTAEQQVKHLVLKLEGVTQADLAALQLLCAMHRQLLDSGKQISIAGNIPRAFHDAVSAAGYTDCVKHGDTLGLWKGGSD
jgi:anti-anti-sigma factor